MGGIGSACVDLEPLWRRPRRQAEGTIQCVLAGLNDCETRMAADANDLANVARRDVLLTDFRILRPSSAGGRSPERQYDRVRDREPAVRSPRVRA